ncbi:hypothetical protein A2V82_02285 [candidate division KSB1 bacterium RBG_16_48_16]|nr:MAG: hypothetical protein A2V82_02285 [candidate division KSB1 bacterium RBG_16_48_16]
MSDSQENKPFHNPLERFFKAGNMAASDTPKCPFGHPTAVIYEKTVTDESKNRQIVYKQCNLAGAIDDAYGDRKGAMMEAGCPAAESAKEVNPKIRLDLFKKKIRTQAKCKYFSGKWLADV